MQGENIIALDVGNKRVGLAMAHKLARLPSPYVTLVRDDDFWPKLQQIIAKEQVGLIVVGLPRNLSGGQTDQTETTQKFIEQLAGKIHLPIKTTDEALTSRQAKAELLAKGKPFDKSDIDALAATIILQDYLNTNIVESRANYPDKP